MQKWEYLRSGYMERINFIVVRRDKADAMLQYLQSRLPNSKVKVETSTWPPEAGDTLIKVESSRMNVYDALGEAGWETFDGEHFKRPLA